MVSVHVRLLFPPSLGESCRYKKICMAAAALAMPV